jgi:putative ABC transport system permease protein
MNTKFRQYVARVGAFLRRPALDRDFSEELDSHFTMLVEDLVASGMPLEQARQKARLDLGARAQLLKAHRAARGLPALEMLLRDLWRAVQILSRHPGLVFIAGAMICLSRHGRQHRLTAVVILLTVTTIWYLVAQRAKAGLDRRSVVSA